MNGMMSFSAAGGWQDSANPWAHLDTVVVRTKVDKPVRAKVE
jgi:hypothetical protein